MAKKMFEKDLIDYEVKCPFCGAVTKLKVHPVSLEAYKNGALAQDAFANMTPAEREVLISGLCMKCQEDIFKEPEDEDEWPE